MASLVPAQVLGLSDRGRLAVGHRADLAVLTPDLEPLCTIVGGEPL
jgi:N-acetylglucosamine-6-phosphate deacetylase